MFDFELHTITPAAAFNSPGFNTVNYSRTETCLLETKKDADELKQRLVETRYGMQQRFIVQLTDEW